MKKLLVALVCLMMISTAIPALAVNEDVSGKVTIYTSMYQFVIDMMSEAVKTEFPNLEVEFFYGGTGALQTKLTGEMETGVLGCDMMLVAEPAYSLELKEGGWLHPYVIDGASEKLRFPYDDEASWYPVRVCNMVLAYNPELNSADTLPASFYDFAFDKSLKRPDFPMGQPPHSGTTMAAVAALSDKVTAMSTLLPWAKTRDDRVRAPPSAKLQTGECKVIMILEESVLKIRKEEGSKIACIYPTDGNIMITSTVMTVAEERSLNANIEACEAITDWLLSDAGQKFVLEGYMHAVAKGMTEVPFDSIDTDGLIATDMGVDWVRCYTMREEIRTQFQERVTQ